MAYTKPVLTTTTITCQSNTVYDGHGQTIYGRIIDDDGNIISQHDHSSSSTPDYRFTAFKIPAGTENVTIKNWNFVNVTFVAIFLEPSGNNSTQAQVPWPYSSNIHMINCTLHTDIAPRPFINYWGSSQVVDQDGDPTNSDNRRLLDANGGMFFYAGRGVRPRNCSLVSCRATGNARLLLGGPHSIGWLVADNYCKDSEDTCIYMKGNFNRIYRNTVINAGKDGIKVLQNPYIDPVTGLRSVTVAGSSTVTPDNGQLDINQLWSYSHIAGNYVENHSQRKPDGGACIMIWTPGNLIENNVVKNTIWGNTGHKLDPDSYTSGSVSNGNHIAQDGGKYNVTGVALTTDTITPGGDKSGINVATSGIWNTVRNNINILPDATSNIYRANKWTGLKVREADGGGSRYIRQDPSDDTAPHPTDSFWPDAWNAYSTFDEQNNQEIRIVLDKEQYGDPAKYDYLALAKKRYS